MSHTQTFYRRVAIAPLCLCLVAGLHFARVVRLGQTPWKGGGFGMFSTVDSEAARYLRCYLVTDEGKPLPVDVPGFLEGFETALRVAPQSQRAEELAARLAELHWHRSESSNRLTGTVSPADHEPAIPFQAVRVEVWRYRFDATTRNLQAAPLLSVTQPRAEAAP
jgi:hypothetical protein